MTAPPAASPGAVCVDMADVMTLICARWGYWQPGAAGAYERVLAASRPVADDDGKDQG